MATRRSSLAEVVAKGDRRASLVALRDRLAIEIDVADGRDLAALSLRLQSVLAEIEALPSTEVVSPRDEVAARRKTRRTAAGVVDGAASGNKRRR